MRRILWVLLGVLVLTVGCLGGPTETGPEPLEPGQDDGPFTNTTVFPGEYSANQGPSSPLHPGPYGIAAPEIVTFESDVDGSPIEMALIHPENDDAEPMPVVLSATPYLFDGLSPETIENHPEHARLAQNLVPHGYTVAFLPVRGTANQGGCMDMMGPNEQADLDQAVTWLGTQDWSNGNVGMVGISYDGTTPWMVAANGNPHLKTIVPIAGITDPFELMYRNGTVHWLGAGIASIGFYTFGFYTYNEALHGNDRAIEHAVDGAICPTAWEGITASLIATTTIERQPAHYWDARDFRQGVLDNYQGSILNVHGLQDWRVPPSQVYPFLNTLEEQGILVKHILGQWGHQYPDSSMLPDARMDWAEILLRWLDHELKQDTTTDIGPPVQVQDNQGHWRNAPTWPPTNTTTTTFYLAPNEALASHPETPSGTEHVGPDPNDDSLQTFANFASSGILNEATGDHVPHLDLPCHMCAWFQTEPLTSELRFAGLPTLHATLTPHGPQGHIAAFLFSLDDENTTRLGHAQIDLRVAHGDQDPRPVTPQSPVTAKLEFEPLDVAIPEGERLGVLITQTAAPERLPTPASFPVDLHVGSDASTLTIEAFEPDTEAFFVPPTR